MFDVCARSCLLVHAGLFGEKAWHGRNNLVLFRMADKLLTQTYTALGMCKLYRKMQCDKCGLRVAHTLGPNINYNDIDY